MCWNCWAQAGFSAIDNPVVREAARAIEAVYDHSMSGGNLHVVIDDWNYEDDQIGPEHDWRWHGDATPDQIAGEQYCLGLLRAMSEPERASALALHDGFWGHPDSGEPIHNDATLQAAIDHLNTMLIDWNLPEDDWRLEGLGNAIEAYETRTDILNREPDGSEKFSGDPNREEP